MIVRPGEIQDSINSLAEGKSSCLDGSYAEHSKYSSLNYRLLLARCITSLLVHGSLPDYLMSVVFVPIIKDKSGMINSKDNYIPMAIASTMSKLLEKILLERLKNYLITSSHQFGFNLGIVTRICTVTDPSQSSES